MCIAFTVSVGVVLKNNVEDTAHREWHHSLGWGEALALHKSGQSELRGREQAHIHLALLLTADGM